jgi:multidrug resistance efflux pump
MIRWGPWVMMFITLSLALVGVWMGPTQGVLGYAEVAEVQLLASDNAIVGSLTVREGDRVLKGDPIVRLDAPRLHGQRDVLQARAAMLQARSEATAHDARGDAQELVAQLASAQADLASARAEARALETSIARRQAWVSQGLAGADAVADDQVALAAVTSRAAGMTAVVSELQRAVDNAAVGASPEAAALAAARLELDVVQRQIEVIDTQLAALQVRAPHDGYVSQLSVREGAHVRRGAPLLTIIPERAKRVVVCLTEAEALDVEPQSEVLLWPRDGRDAVSGVVLSVGALVAEPDPRCRTILTREEFIRPAYIRLDEGVHLAAGTRVVARFLGVGVTPKLPAASSASPDPAPVGRLTP